MTLMLCAHLTLAQSAGVPAASEKEAVVKNSTSTQWGPPYPFTEDDIRQKLVQVLRVPANDLSKEKIEDIFDMKMLNSDRLLPESLNGGKWYNVYSKTSVDWYFVVGVVVLPKKTNFTFTWWNYSRTPDPYVVPMCLNILPLLKDIEVLKLGWVERLPDPLWKPDHGPSPRHEFFRGKDEWLHVDYVFKTNCLTALTFGVNTTNGN